MIQERGLKRGSQIVVGTPGRIRDLIDKKTLNLANVAYVVLDEADEMLNMGFEEEVREILKSVPAQRRMLLFSATMPAPILRLAKTFMKDYDLVEVKKEQVTADLTEQIYFEVRDSERFEALTRIIDVEPDFYGLVFCRTKIETDAVSRKLNDRGYEAESIHGDITQSQREMIIKKFKSRKTTILVATDVAARGIDINDLTHVINYNLPQDPEAYIHRIGRTGRAGKEGTAITFITPAELRELLFIQKIARTTIKKEKMPTVQDVIASKKARIKAEIVQLIDGGEYQEYVSMAHELIDDGGSPERVIAALLKFNLKDSLNAEAYQQISESNSGSVDSKGTARLFVALGREQDYNPAKLAKFLEEEGSINQSAIKDIKVYDKFSFITVTFMEAEQLLAVFSKNKNGRKPLVTKAKERDNNSGGGNRPWQNKNNDGFRGERKPFAEKKQFSSKPEFKAPKPTETAPFEPAPAIDKGNRTEQKPVRKRENKLTDYLDKGNKGEGDKGDKADKGFTKSGKKKTSTTTEVDEFLKKYDDDLKW